MALAVTTFEQVRAMLPAARDHVYLNSAATSPTPTPVRRAMSAYEEDRAHRGEAGWDDWMRNLGAARETTASLFGAHADEVAFSKNTSDAITLVAQGIRWKRGDVVVLTDQEFPSNILPWKALGRFGVEVRMVAAGPNGRIEEADVEAAIDARTRLVATSHVIFTTGQRLDVQRLARSAHDAGAEILVDTIQASGVVDSQFGQWDVDYLACGGHKWLMAPFGVGALIVRRDRIHTLSPVAVGWFGLADDEDFSPANSRLVETARRFEIGNLNFGGIEGWRAAIELLVSVEGRPEQVERLTSSVWDGCSSLGLTPATPQQWISRAGIISVPVADVASTVQGLRDDGVLVAARGRYVRIATHFWNTPADVQRALEGLARHGQSID